MASLFRNPQSCPELLRDDGTPPDLLSHWPKWWPTIPIALLALLMVSLLLPLRSNRTAGLASPPLSSSPGPRLSIVSGTHLATDFRTPNPQWLQDTETLWNRLLPHLEPLAAPQPGEWLAAHPEHGQTFAEYLQVQPNRPTSARHTLYILPIGPFTETQWHILSISAEFLSHYFRLPVKVLPQRSLNSLPPRSGRDHFGNFQLHTGTLLSRVLWPSLPSDAAALLGLTAIDLYPEASWNFVFGEATFTARVGVWSLARFGNPDFDPTFLRKVLRRTLSTATHETGHMFGMAHCTKHHCNMNGANSLEEADRTPLTLCADCLAKLTWLTAARAESWLDDIERFLHEHQLDEDAAQFGALHKALTPEDSRLETGASGS